MTYNCQNCNNILSRKQKFCNASCSAIYNNARRTKLSRDKQKVSIRKSLYNDENIIGTFSPLYQLICKECKLSFCSRTPIKSYCSKICLSSFKKKEYASRSDISKNNSYQGILKGVQTRGLRSKQEIELFNLCHKHFINVSHNEKIINGWDADIILHDYKIAILWNGPWHYKQMPHKNHSLLQVQTRDKIKIKLFSDAGWTVLTYEDRYYTPESAFNNVLVVSTRIELVKSAYETDGIPLT